MKEHIHIIALKQAQKNEMSFSWKEEKGGGGIGGGEEVKKKNDKLIYS